MADPQAKQVRQFVQNLDREDRYIVLLYYADGLTPVEIARVLDLPNSRVRTRLHELRASLAHAATRPKPPARLGSETRDTPPTRGNTTPAAFA